MSVDDLEKYEAEMELALYREYRDVLPMFSHVIETDKRFYLANGVDLIQHTDGADTYFELKLTDAWVWDMYRSARFVSSVRPGLAGRHRARITSAAVASRHGIQPASALSRNQGPRHHAVALDGRGDRRACRLGLTLAQLYESAKRVRFPKRGILAASRPARIIAIPTATLRAEWDSPLIAALSTS